MEVFEAEDRSKTPTQQVIYHMLFLKIQKQCHALTTSIKVLLMYDSNEKIYLTASFKPTVHQLLH